MPTNALAPPARNAMLRPYAPSWREQIEAYFMGDSRPSPERRQFAQGLTSILGLVPGVGSVLQAQEAAQSGDRKGVAMAMLPIPGAARAGAVAKAAEREAPHIIAYHGSPHSFDRFDMSKIGTGEGAQAYGHGLYFAENENVAKEYKNLQPMTDPTDGGMFYARGALAAGGGKTDAAIKFLMNKRAETEAASKFLMDGGKSNLAQIDDAIARINAGEFKPGSMYQVRINADPEHFLDWDKPLSEQSPVVQEAYAKARGATPPPDRNASAAYTDLYLTQRANEAARNGVDRQAFASQALQEAGIPGIKYLDQGSRSAGEGSRNYVVFDDKLVEIMKKYGLVGPIGAGIALKILQRRQPPET